VTLNWQLGNCLDNDCGEFFGNFFSSGIFSGGKLSRLGNVRGIFGGGISWTNVMDAIGLEKMSSECL